MDISFSVLEISHQPKYHFWVTILNFEIGDQQRSFTHIEKSQGVWKFQLLWLNNRCWILK